MLHQCVPCKQGFHLLSSVLQLASSVFEPYTIN